MKKKNTTELRMYKVVGYEDDDAITHGINAFDAAINFAALHGLGRVEILEQDDDTHGYLWATCKCSGEDIALFLERVP